MTEPIKISIELSSEQVAAIANRVALIVAEQVTLKLHSQALPSTPAMPPATWDGTERIKTGKNAGKMWSELPDATITYLCNAAQPNANAVKERARRSRHSSTIG
jgi:hypothetical protein